MKPVFRFLPDNRFPRDQAGTATWGVGDQAVTQRFATLREAQAIDRLLFGTWREGIKEGQAHVVRSVALSLREYRVRLPPKPLDV